MERGGGHGHIFEDALQLGGSTDGERSTELAVTTTCRTAFGEIVAPDGEKEERGCDTSRENGPTADGGSDDAVGDSLTGSAGETQVSAKAKPQEHREREGVADRSATGEGSTNSTTRGRVAPPMLRLDALDSALDTKEGASPHFCSSPAAVTLSAASTRAASEHLVSSSA